MSEGAKNIIHTAVFAKRSLLLIVTAKKKDFKKNKYLVTLP